LAEEIDAYTNSVSGGLNHLGETWRDPHYFEFKDAFDEIRLYLHELSAEARTIAPYLKRDADIIDKRKSVGR
jgi:hypothetical protein